MTIPVQKNDWSLSRKALIDQQRHREKIKEAIKKNLNNIISQEDIILSDGIRTVKVPIRSLEEYKFRYDPNSNKGVGQGSGNSRVGDVIGQGEEAGEAQAQGEAGTEPGTDYFEADVSMEEIAQMIFEDLDLPNLQEKKQAHLEAEGMQLNDIRRSGPMPNLDKKRSILANIKRNAMHGSPKFQNLQNDDLRFKSWDTSIQHESNAVIIAMMDVSGSMGEFEKYIARTFYFWMLRFLRTKYANVQIIFIAHHTEAKEVTEQEFFTRGESGGTKVSSAYELAMDMIKRRYNPTDWNIYPFHFSDGDNQSSDNEHCVDLVRQLIDVSNIFGYGEIRQYEWSYTSTLMSVYEEIHNDKFKGITITDKKDVYQALRRFFAREGAAAGSK